MPSLNMNGGRSGSDKPDAAANVTARLCPRRALRSHRGPAKSLAQLEALQRLRPRDPAILREIGRRSLALSRQEPALRAYQALLEQEPNDLEALKRVGQLLAWSGDRPRARQALERFNRLKGGDYEVHYLLGEIYTAEHDEGRARADTRRPCGFSHRGQPRDRPTIMVRLLVALAIAAAGVAPAAAQAPPPLQAPAIETPEGGAAQAAASPIAPATQAPPAPQAQQDTREAEAIRARLLSRLGRTEEALAAFAALLAKYPDDLALRADHVELLLDAGFTDRAGSRSRPAPARDPRSARIRRLQARLEIDRGAPQRAAEILAALVEESPDDIGLRADLASARLAAGRWRRRCPSTRISRAESGQRGLARRSS